MLAMEENVYQTELTLVNFLERSALVFPGETTAVMATDAIAIESW